VKLVVAVAVSWLVACGGVQDRDRDREIARVHAHLARVEGELVARPPAALTPAQQRARARVVADLHDYTEARRYPTNDTVPGTTPIFIDEYGARCAMAALIEDSGDRALVARVARDHDYAHVADLAGDPELGRWLADHGVTLAEAAAIQPSYSNADHTRWTGTVSVVGSTDAGGVFGGGNSGAFGWLAGGVRVGVRRIRESVGACDRCVFRTEAFVGEYQRTDGFGAGVTNQLGLYWQHDTTQQARDHQFYTIAGPVAFVGGDGDTAIGARVGVGASLQRRTWPWFAEIAVSELTSAHAETARVGVSAGLVF
jgi:hypothetical protein